MISHHLLCHLALDEYSAMTIPVVVFIPYPTNDALIIDQNLSSIITTHYQYFLSLVLVIPRSIISTARRLHLSIKIKYPSHSL